MLRISSFSSFATVSACFTLAKIVFTKQKRKQCKKKSDAAIDPKPAHKPTWG